MNPRFIGDSWQGGTAFACAVAVWVFVGIPAMLVTDDAGNLFQGLVLVLGTAFGIGLAIFGLRAPGTKNKVFAGLAVALIAIYLLPVLVINLARAIGIGG